MRNPAPGTYRLKVVAKRPYGPVRAGLAWTMIRGPSTPQLAVVADTVSMRTGQPFEIAPTVTTNG